MSRRIVLGVKVQVLKQGVRQKDRSLQGEEWLLCAVLPEVARAMVLEAWYMR